MANEWWMRPALQTSEAVLLPALAQLGAFQPATEEWKPQPEPTPYIRPRGSMAGRSVLRAVGMGKNRSTARLRPHRW